MENKMALAGLRNTAEAVHRLPGQIRLGTVLASFFKKVLLENLHLREMLLEMTSGKLPAEVLDDMSQKLDKILALARENLAKILSCRDTAAVRTGLCSTDIRAHLLERWAQVAQDPGVGVCGWLKFGANAGLCADPVGLDGVFPVDSHEEPGDEALCTQDGVPMSSVADDPEAMKHIQEYVDQGWLEHTTRAKLQEEYADDHTISEFCCITKVKNGNTKRRTILDLKKSGVSKRTRKTHRVVLPRLSDPVQDLLDLLATRNAHQSVEVFVLDFSDAFWQIPLAPEERRHFIGFDG